MAEVKLKAMEAYQEEVHKGIVRIDTETMKAIGVGIGDIVEIEGTRKTVGIVDRGYPTDVGMNYIRMDGIMRRNAKTGLGEIVTVRKAEVKEAKNIIIAPAQQGVFIKADPEVFRRGLLGRAVVSGDIVALGGASRRRKTMSGNPFFDEMFSDFEESFMGNFAFGGLLFIIAEVHPKQPVIITENTIVKVNPKSVEVQEESKFPEVTYEDIGGLEVEVKKIREMVELPLKHPELFERLGIQPPKGVLLHGPPGCGKTLLAKAVANESDAKFFSINGPEVVSKFVGEAEKKIREIFDEAEKSAPSIIFIDEIDAIASKREEAYGEVEKRMVAQLLTTMDGLKARGKVIVMAATNRPHALDPALRRPGRFDREINIGIPSKEGRLNILKIHTRHMPLYHYDFKTECEVLMKKLSSFESENLKEIEILEEKKKVLMSNKSSKTKELKELSEELDKLETERNSNDETILKRVLNKIGLKHSEIASVKSQITILEKDIKYSEENIPKLREEIKQIDILLNKIKIDKKLLEEIIKEIKTENHLREVRGLNDPRNKIMDKGSVSLTRKEDVNNIVKYLIGIEVVNEDYRHEVEKESIRYMITKFAGITHGFVGADMEALCKEAAMHVIRRILPDINFKDNVLIPPEILGKLQILEIDFSEALKTVSPSALREVLIEIPNVKWDDIGGLQNIKQELNEAVEWPLKYGATFRKLGVRPPRGVLLYGPPGCGKTLLAKAVANESEANFILVKGPELISKWVGDSEKGIREIFKKARQSAPTIIFFDEIDAIAPRRGMSMSGGTNVTERVVNQLLTEMDGLEDLTDVVVIAATNRPDIIDPGLLRPGRFDRIVLVSPPDKTARKDILKVHISKMPLCKDVNLDVLVDKTENYVGADIEAVCREAAILAMREDLKAKDVAMKHFEDALKKVKSSIINEDVQKYREIEEGYIRAARNGLVKGGGANYFG